MRRSQARVGRDARALKLDAPVQHRTSNDGKEGNADLEEELQRKGEYAACLLLSSPQAR